MCIDPLHVDTGRAERLGVDDDHHDREVYVTVYRSEDVLDMLSGRGVNVSDLLEGLPRVEPSYSPNRCAPSQSSTIAM